MYHTYVQYSDSDAQGYSVVRIYHVSYAQCSDPNCLTRIEYSEFGVIYPLSIAQYSDPNAQLYSKDRVKCGESEQIYPVILYPLPKF